MSDQEKVIEQYVVKEGLVRILQFFGEDGSSYYDAYWTPNFWFMVRLGEGSAWAYTLEYTRDYVLRWGEKPRLLADMGEYPIYIGYFDNVPHAILKNELNLVKEMTDLEKAEARDVRVGTYLVGHARDFFIFWKGEEVLNGRWLL
jgi:hypothetical protein